LECLECLPEFLLMKGCGMKTRLTSRILGLACVLGGAIALGTGCESEKGPAEKAGESVDRAAQKVKDTISPPGPAEKAGRAVDKALNP
jgi:hypothetical protein